MSVPFYFVCVRCEAKWFFARGSSACPRCSAMCESIEQLTPPWLAPRPDCGGGKGGTSPRTGSYSDRDRDARSCISPPDDGRRPVVWYYLRVISLSQAGLASTTTEWLSLSA
jgi:hypothetical protein